ncbi:MFS transporter [Agromyces mariniharenae]|uniref:MFS transporter n=1 Tax=Agromyces mariniharenae TaxID=2604423 RepID=A0A5S4V787_9MICO|nr:MFS transporter [Agromyces mariniharenae]TYL53988.1 MFS transporter [Agromyces mariniharenae]
MDRTSTRITPSEAALPDRPAPAPRGLPWPSLLVLGGTAFVMVTAEMLPTAVLPEMSAGLGVTEAQTGFLVSLWAAVVVVGSLPLVRLTRRLDRRSLIVWSLVGLAASVAVTALAPTYPIAVGGRLAGALAVGLLWATTNAYTADLVADRDLARAVAVVLGGATLGTVLGTPIGSLVAQGVGWRAAFAGLAVAAVVAAVLVRTVVRRPTATTPIATTDAAQAPITPTDAAPTDDQATPASHAASGTLRPMLAIVGLVALLLVGHYGVYTFVTRLVDAPAQAMPGGVGGMLLAFGVASWLGIVLAGRFGARTARVLVAGAIVTAIAVAALALVGVHPAVGIAVVVVWGVASGALPALAQTMILRLAGTERRSLAGALIPVVFNLGIAIGAGLAALVVDSSGVAALPPLGAAVVAVAAAGLFLVLRRPGAAA